MASYHHGKDKQNIHTNTHTFAFRSKSKREQTRSLAHSKRIFIDIYEVMRGSRMCGFDKCDTMVFYYGG